VGAFVLKSGKLLHSVADLFPRQPQLVESLKVEPKLRTGAKPVAETQCRVGRDTALSIDDSSHAVHRHVNLPGQLCGRDAEFLKFFGKMLAGVNRAPRHVCLLVVIRYFDIDWSR
jgi:hypothetical protein